MKVIFLKKLAAFTVLVFFVFGHATSVDCQDLRTIDPQRAPPQIDPPSVPSAPQKDSGFSSDETIQVDALKRLIFIFDINQLQTRPQVPENGLDTHRLPRLQSPECRSLISAYLNQPVSMASLNRMVSELYLYYRSIDLPFVSITLPEQDISNGVIQVMVIESALGEIKIKGNRFFSEKLYRSGLRLKPGDPIYKSVIDEDVKWINENPFRRAAAYVAPGKDIGTTDLVLKTRERFPFRLFCGYNDSGTTLTDLERLLAGFNWGNAFGLGHQMSYQYTTNPDFELSQGHSLTYEVPIQWRDRLTISGAYSRIKSALEDPLSQTGKSGQISLRYQKNLAGIEDFDHQLSAVFDFKYSDNNLEFADIPITDNVTHVIQLSLIYSAMNPDPWGNTVFRCRLTGSPGGLSPRNKNDYFEKSRAYAEAEYYYVNVGLSRNQRLPYGFSLFLAGTFQQADGNLLGSEQLSFGGSDSIRGYDQGAVEGDEGFFINMEIRTPPIHLSRLAGFRDPDDQLQLIAFHDYGTAKNIDLMSGEDPEVILQSIGLGLRLFIGRYFSLTADYGWQQKALEGAGRDSRAHISCILSY